MRTAVVGSRKLTDVTLVNETLDKLDISFVVSGGAIGADTLGVDWAKAKGLPYKEYLPDWKKYPKSEYHYKAIFARNDEIADDCEQLVAFWTGEEKGGTWYTLSRAKARGIPVHIVLITV